MRISDWSSDVCSSDLEGVIDLIKMKTIIWDMAAHGTTFTYAEIPAEMADKAAKARAFMVEAAAESSEHLMNKYLADGELSDAAIYAGLRPGTLADGILPVFSGPPFQTPQSPHRRVGNKC